MMSSLEHLYRQITYLFTRRNKTTVTHYGRGWDLTKAHIMDAHDVKVLRKLPRAVRETLQSFHHAGLAVNQFYVEIRSVMYEDMSFLFYVGNMDEPDYMVRLTYFGGGFLNMGGVFILGEETPIWRFLALSEERRFALLQPCELKRMLVENNRAFNQSNL